MTPLDRAIIEHELERCRAAVGRPLVLLATTGSTNDDAKRAAHAGAPHGAAFLADEQTGGRGRGDHRWHSPPGENVYLSLVLRPAIAAAELGALSPAVGLAVARVVDASLGAARARIKWPNDVYVDERKIAGILIEATARGNEPPVIVAGVGVNVLGTRFPEELAARATSLVRAGATPDRSAIAGALLVAIGQVLDELSSQGFAALRDELTARDFLRGRTVRVGGVAGVAEGFDARGWLLVRDTSGTLHALVAGEVAHEV